MLATLEPVLRLGLGLGWSGLCTGRLRRSSNPQADLQAHCAWILAHFNVELEIVGRPGMGAPLWVANHMSWLDPVALLALRPAGSMAKAEVADYPVLGVTLRRAGLVFVKRDDPRSRAFALLRMARDLAARRPFLLFPEGTTTEGGSLADLYGGGVEAARRLGCPIQPVRLDSSDPHYPWIGDRALLGHLWGLARARQTRLRIHFRPVLDPRDHDDPQVLLQALRNSLRP